MWLLPLAATGALLWPKVGEESESERYARSVGERARQIKQVSLDTMRNTPNYLSPRSTLFVILRGFYSVGFL